VGSPPMNLFAGYVVDHAQLDLGPVEVSLPEPLKARMRLGRKVTLGVRPEEARLATDDSAAPDGFQLRGMVEIVEPDYARHKQLLHLRTGQIMYTALLNMDVPPKIGDQIDVVFPQNKFYFFDGENEERIR
jgi:ABC-type sugar transport system ATPase subunit